MSDEQKELDRLITAIEGNSIAGATKAGAIALFGYFPYVGRSLAAILASVAGQRRIEKICEALAYLDEKIDAHLEDPNQYLTQDQVIEVVHRIVSDLATESDQRKTESLKNALANSFTMDLSFEIKQVYLSLVRQLTPIEIRVLSRLYGASDPFIVYDDPRPIEVTQAGIFTQSAVTSVIGAGGLNSAFEQWVKSGNKSGSKTLRKYLIEEINVESSLLISIFAQLDGKGLSQLTSNLDRSNVVVMKKAIQGNFGIVAVPVFSLTGPANVEESPLQDSRTRLGLDFLAFCS